jgi:glycosyltransferase involved in cell wall biosynthesis
VISEIAVIVPAHNEQDTIGDCLSSIWWAEKYLLQQSESPPRVRLVVVLDDCRDATANRTGDAEVVTISDRCVGAARAAGARQVMSRGLTPASQLWLANTDADSTVAQDWLLHQWQQARAGTELLLGTAVPYLPGPALGSRWRALHNLSDGHPYVHGANLGIRADVYRRLGGWARLKSGEDVDMAARAQLAGVRITRSAASPVATSARLVGRAPAGYATFLSELVSETAGGAV